MDEPLYSEELASIRELADRWDLNTHQLTYIVRSRNIPHAKMIGLARFFNASQQRAIYAHFHKHLPVEGDIDAFMPRIEAFDEEEAMEKSQDRERLAAVEAENKVLREETKSLREETKSLRDDMTFMLKQLAQRGERDA